jgi:ribonuclease G
VNAPKKGAPGDQPAAAPAEKDGGTSVPAAGEGKTFDDAAPKRRRGNRGGRRHKRPAVVPSTLSAETTAGSSPRDGYSAAPQRAAVDDLPTAPLIPVAAPTSSRPRETAAPAAEPVPQPDGGRGRGRSRSRAGAGKREREERRPAPVAPAMTREIAAPAAVPAVAKAAMTPVAESGNAPETRETRAGGDESVEPHAKRRRRGGRGGRRRHRTADIEHAEAAREAEEAAGEPAVHDSSPEARVESEAGGVIVAEGAPADDAAGATAGEADSAGAATESGAKRRRRGGRGGRGGRGKREADGDVAPEAVADAEAPAPARAAKAADAKPDAKTKGRPREHRRPKAIVRQDEGSGLGTSIPLEPGPRRTSVKAEKPERKIILVTDDGEELRVALVEDGRLAEIYIERPDRKSYLGDIYQGKVENVMNGIDAAFVDFGLEKNGFLYVDEVTTPEGEKRARRIGDALKNGQQVMVQVTKDPMGHKGARLSTKISLAGRYLVYVPGGSGVGVSRRLGQGERERLRDISKELKPKNAGLIVRTIAEGHGLEDLKRDMRYLSRLWSRLKKKAETVKAPGLVHKEVDISLEVTRDLFNDTCESLIVDDPKRHKAILSFLDKEAPELLPKVHLHTGEEPLFSAYGIEEQIVKALERRVPLPSGGNLVIDHAEALTVIDVNTGRFTRGKGLEDTITKTNLEAAREVVRQLRLRDIGGIIIIDAIDMAHAKNREMVLATLEAELETDRTKTYVVELSPLGLIEMTRQNTTDGARGILTRACPTCSGKARVLSEETMALSVERRVRALARKSQAKAWLIEVNGAVAERLNGARLKRLEKQVGRRVFLEGGTALPVESFRVISEGSLEHVQEQRVPVKEGQEVTVELEFSLTYSPRDAVGYVDGYMIIVEGGRQHLGKRRRVRVTEIARTGARATVLKKDAKEAN